VDPQWTRGPAGALQNEPFLTPGYSTLRAGRRMQDLRQPFDRGNRREKQRRTRRSPAASRG
jgi:hypothetical protein